MDELLGIGGKEFDKEYERVSALAFDAAIFTRDSEEELNLEDEQFQIMLNCGTAMKQSRQLLKQAIELLKQIKNEQNS